MWSRLSQRTTNRAFDKGEHCQLRDRVDSAQQTKQKLNNVGGILGKVTIRKLGNV